MKTGKNIQDVYTLTPMQEGMLFHALSGQDRTAYFQQYAYRLEGCLDIGLLEQSFEALLERHEVLRTAFVYKNVEQPLQVVLKKRSGCFLYEDLCTRFESVSQRENYIKSFKEATRRRGMDLTSDPLMKIAVFCLAPETYEVIWTYHHIIMDGWCMPVLNRDFFEIYCSSREGKLPALESVRPFREYIKWIETQDKKRSGNYWAHYLEGYGEPAGVPRQRNPRPEPTQTEVIRNTETVEIDAKIVDGLIDLAAKNQTTLHTVFQAIWGIILAKYNGKKDVVFGNVVAGRPSEIVGIETMIGLFINTVPVRVRFHRNTPLLALVADQHQAVLASEPHQYFPLAEIQADSPLKQELLDHILASENYPTETRMQGDIKSAASTERNPGFKVTGLEFTDQAHYDFYLEIIARGEMTPGGSPGKNSLTVNLVYNTAFFEPAFIRQMGEHIRHMAAIAVENPTACIDHISLVTAPEKQQILYRFNKATLSVPGPDGVHLPFSPLLVRQVERTPDAVAGKCLESHLSYRQLLRDAVIGAETLKEKGIQTDDIVAVMASRSLRYWTAIMAVWFAHGAYMPIDPDYPQERIDYMLKDSGAPLLVITSDKEGEKVRIGASKKLAAKPFVDNGFESRDSNRYPGLKNERSGARIEASYLQNFPNLAAGHWPPATSLAYVIYTSGSTGRPKGALLEHAGMVNHLLCKIDELRLQRNSVVAQNASPCFDISVWQCAAVLLAGGRTVIYPQPQVLDVREFAGLTVRDGVTVLEVVPSYLTALLEEMAHRWVKMDQLQWLLITGEEVPPAGVEKWRALYPGIPMLNAYGPTEAADDITHYRVTGVPRGPRVPIGKPLANLNVYILDHAMQLNPVGIAGEIVVSGIGVGRGYLNDAARTREVFSRDPFKGGGKLRLYHTGDLGRWLPDGNIEFLGRKDHQVKIRGHRIELGEIGSRLTRMPGIKNAVVIVQQLRDGGQYLCAYYSAGEEYDYRSDEIKEFLSEKLPNYMIPSWVVRLEQIPLTPNGKVDRKKLPVPDLNDPSATRTGYAPPHDEYQKLLVPIWEKLLLKKPVGIDDNFFEIGGNSLKATVLMARVEQAFRKGVPLLELFNNPTIRELAGYLRRLQEVPLTTLEPVEKRSYYRLSTAHERLYVLNRLEKGTAYNITAAVRMEGKLDWHHFRHRFQESVRSLVQRHESLRTRFEKVRGNIVQVIEDSVEITVEGFEESRPGRIEQLVDRFVRPFDLSRAPLLRVGMIHAAEEKNLLMFDLHHIIADGISMEILVREFLRLYRGDSLLPIALQYKDFSEWQDTYLHSQTVKKQESYWLRELAGELPRLNLPTDFPRGGVRSFEGSAVRFHLEEDRLSALKTMALEENVTIFMLLMAIFHVFLARICNQEEIITGTVVAGRRHRQLEQVIGMFVNTLVLRTFPSEQKTFAAFLAEIKQTLLNAFENQDYPFDYLVKKLDVHREINRNPLFDAIFVIDNENDNPAPAQIPGVEIKPFPLKNRTAKFDFLLTCRESPANTYFELEYSTRLFKPDTIQRLISYYKEVADAISRDKSIKLSQVKISHDLLTAKSYQAEMEFEF